MIKGLLVFAVIVGAGAFMAADIMRPDRGETTHWPGSWPVQHAEWFGVLTGLTVFVVGLLVITASNSERRD